MAGLTLAGRVNIMSLRALVVAHTTIDPADVRVSMDMSGPAQGCRR